MGELESCWRSPWRVVLARWAQGAAGFDSVDAVRRPVGREGLSQLAEKTKAKSGISSS
jgi:hypothetical protein